MIAATWILALPEPLTGAEVSSTPNPIHAQGTNRREPEGPTTDAPLTGDRPSPETLAGPVAVTSELIGLFAGIASTNNPGLRAARARASAADFNTAGVRRWMDPDFRIGGSIYNERWMSPKEQGNLTYGIEQRLPLFGKEKAAMTVARAEAAMIREDAAGRARLLRRDLAAALFSLAEAHRVAEIGREDLDWLDQMSNSMKARYEGGMATPVDVLRVQNERAKRADQLITSRRRIDEARARVNRLIGRDVRAALPELALPELAGPLEFNRRLVEMARRAEPRLKVLRKEIQQGEATVAATRKARLPDVALGVDNRQYTGGGEREGMFSMRMNLPWLNRSKYRADSARDERKLTATREELEEARIEVDTEIHHLTIEIDAARRQALLYQDQILPRTTTALAAAHAAWSANRGMLLDVMEARRMLLEGKIELAGAVARQWVAMSEILLCCGLEDMKDLTTDRPEPQTRTETGTDSPQR